MKKKILLITIAGFLLALSLVGCAHKKCLCGQETQPAVQSAQASAPAAAPAAPAGQYIK